MQEGSRRLAADSCLGCVCACVSQLPVWKMSSYRHDVHINSRNATVPQGATGDCTHWCMPGVVETWVKMLAALMRAHHAHPNLHDQATAEASRLNGIIAAPPAGWIGPGA